MLYSILIYDDEAVTEALSPEEEKARLDKHIDLQNRLRDSGKLKPVARLMPSTAATTVRRGASKPLILDGPFAETKEQLVGFYILDCGSLEEALEAAQSLPLDSGVLEIRPITWFHDGG